MIDSIELAIKNAENSTSDLSLEIIQATGASGTKGRHLHNNLSKLFNNNLSYLEIGTQRGLSFCTALSNINYKYACVIDNWVEGDFRKDFDANTSIFLKDKNFDVYDQDCWTIDIKTQIKQKINFYFYDGDHSAESQEKAFTYYNDIFENEFLCLIDDWNCPMVRQGTKVAFSKLKYSILFERNLFTENYNNVLGAGSGNPNSWWNGLYVGYIKK